LGSIPSTNPDFLWSLVGSLHFMRLPLKERRTRGPVQSCVQEIGAIDGCPILRALCEGWDSQSHPLTSHGKQTCSLGDLGFSVGGKKPQVPPLRSPGFPVETRGVEDLHAALSTESRTRGRR